MGLDFLLLIFLTLHINKVLNDGLPISLYIIGQLSVTPSRFLLKVRHDEQNAIDEAVAGAFAFRQLTKYLLLDGSDYWDIGRILENIVFLELLRRQKKVYIGKMDNLEVDFVAIDENDLTYYQVAATVRDEKTLKRELASLQQIKDQYPKYILTLDEDPCR